MITLKASFDDAPIEDLRIADLMTKYDIPTIFYWPAEWQSLGYSTDRKPLSLQQAWDIADNFEIGSHTVTHPMLTRVPEERWRNEILDSWYYLHELFGQSIDSFCYPRGYANDEIRDFVRQHYTMARNTLVGVLEPPDDPIWQSTTVHVAGVKRKEYEATTWQQEAERLWVEALERSEKGEDVTYSIFGHGWELTYYDAFDDLEALLRRIREDLPS